MTMTTADPLTPAQVSAYLRRLGINTPSPPLHELHLAHLRAIPFENLDIPLGKPIKLDLSSVYRKIVQERRGGYCYELNSLFAALLQNLGYAVELLSARVAHPDGSFGPEFDHLALRVLAHGKAYLADVGFGDAFLEPLPLQDGFTRQEGKKTVKLLRDGEQWTYLEDRSAGFQPQYTFRLQPHALADFEEMHVWQQVAPDSHFTQNRIISRATPAGRISLSGQKLIITENGVRREQELNDTEYLAALSRHFGVVIK